MSVSNFLNREVPTNIKNTVNQFASLIEDSVEFGANLVIWDIGDESDEELNIPPTMMLRHFLELMDAVALLIRHCCADPAKLQLRSCLETAFQLEYLLRENCKERCKAFIVVDRMKQIKMVRMINSKEESGKQYLKTMRNELGESSLKFNVQKLDAFVKEQEAFLRTPRYKKIYNEYIQPKPKMKDWYNLSGGPSNLEELSKRISKHTIYQSVYRDWSNAVHGTGGFFDRLIESNEHKGRVDILSLRYPGDLQAVTSWGLTMSRGLFQAYVKYRLPGKMNDLSQWMMKTRSSVEMLSSTQFIKVNR